MDSVASSIAPAEKMIAPYEPTVYRYSYEGKDLTPEQSEYAVYKRDRDAADDVSLVRFLKTFDLPAINLSTFGDLKMQSLALAEDHKYGYSIYFDFYEQMISISENWNKLA